VYNEESLPHRRDSHCMICLANHVQRTLALAGSARECRSAQNDMYDFK
jgi:hypothetical protein